MSDGGKGPHHTQPGNAGSSVLIIGGGLGGSRVLERLRARGFAGAITLVSDERYGPYDRPPLSKHVLSAGWELERVTLHGADAADRFGARYVLGNPVVALDDNKAFLRDGSALTADHIVIATGLVPRRLPGQPESVHVLRTFDDAVALRTALESARSLIVVGAGFIGAEVATAALARGVSVDMIEALEVPLARILGSSVGAMSARLMLEHGVRLITGTGVDGFEDDTDGSTVVATGGRRLTGDVVLVSVGGVPDLDWFANDAVDPLVGVRCDASGQVLGTTTVWSVGDVAAWQEADGAYRRVEHWSSATEQADVVAASITGSTPTTPAVPYFWSDQFGLKVQVFGHPDDTSDVVQLHGDGLGGGNIAGTVVAHFDEDILTAVTGFGAPRLTPRYRELVASNGSRRATLALTESLS